ncbi:MAG: ATP-binding cassette domain-containing protein [Planctomycetota bacterium]
MGSREKASTTSWDGQPTQLETLRLIRRFGRRHMKVAVMGMLGTIGVVVTHILLPWPLRGVIEVVFPGVHAKSHLHGLLQASGDAVLILCAAYLMLASASGFAEFLQRVWLTRFVSQTVHDMRSTALERVQGHADPSMSPDLIARVVGDSARLKANLKGFLIQVSQNGLLILGITVLFLFLAPKLGLLFLASAVLALWLGYLAVDGVNETSLRQREAESLYALHVQQRVLATASEAREDALNLESSRKQVRTARLVNRTALFGHMAVAATISLAIWVGVSDVRGGRLAPGELFLFMAYALTMHRRAVRVGRQVTRVGKILANAQRLGALIGPDASHPSAPLEALSNGMRLEDVELRSSPSHKGRRRLGPIDLSVAPGAMVAVLGGEGDGKSSLLGVMAGNLCPSEGRILWDGEDLTRTPGRLRSEVSYLPQEPHLERATLRASLAIPAGSEEHALFSRLGVDRVLRRLRTGLDTVVDGTRLSIREQRSLSLLGILLGSASVWVLDTPVAAKGRKDSSRLAAILERASGRTLIAALGAPCLIERFTQVIVMKNGKAVFQGSPAGWRSWRNERRSRELEV